MRDLRDLFVYAGTIRRASQPPLPVGTIERIRVDRGGVVRELAARGPRARHLSRIAGISGRPAAVAAAANELLRRWARRLGWRGSATACRVCGGRTGPDGDPPAPCPLEGGAVWWHDACSRALSGRLYAAAERRIARVLRDAAIAAQEGGASERD